MNDLDLTLKEKVEKVIIAHKRLKDDKEVLSNENQELKTLVVGKQEIINELQDKYNRLKLAKGIERLENEKGYALKQINSIVREINKCIALLNT